MFVSSTSSALGAGSPLGWLCTRTNALAASRTAARSTSLGSTEQPCSPPSAMRPAARRFDEPDPGHLGERMRPHARQADEARELFEQIGRDAKNGPPLFTRA